MNYKNSLDEKERLMLKSSRVCIVGCGGLGGYIAELLIRLGVGKIIAVDGDRFDESNLNRQLLCTHDTVGKSKAVAVAERAALINPELEVAAVTEFLDADNAVEILKDCDLVLDALDSIEARRTLHEACKTLGISMVFGAIGPWHIQYGVVLPESKLFSNIVSSPEYHGETMLSFVPASCASLQVSEAVKLLTGNKSELMGKVCDIDLMTNEQIIFEI
ncbi:MAG: HesA/MoeB/ThiF family protein [Bacillota bacterium]|nr:HesA/MoeB/ThiF family protein [Bacillota bacterium]